MPNRILKESICTNEQIDGLTAFEETVFYRLIVICDDFGRFDGRISWATLCGMKKGGITRTEHVMATL